MLRLQYVHHPFDRDSLFCHLCRKKWPKDTNAGSVGFIFLFLSHKTQVSVKKETPPHCTDGQLNGQSVKSICYPHTKKGGCVIMNKKYRLYLGHGSLHHGRNDVRAVAEGAQAVRHLELVHYRPETTRVLILDPADVNTWCIMGNSFTSYNT